MPLNDYVKTLRLEQWYKNLLIFLAIFFSFNLFDFEKFVLVCIGFVSLSILSSANYVFNDIVDRKSDIKNFNKKQRPIAAGKIPIRNAVLLAIFLLLIGFIIGYLIDFEFFLIMIVFVLLSSLYSIYLKNQMFIDILIIAINFVIRAVAGALIIDVYISPWLILCPFFLSLFLSVGKRRGEIALIGKNASQYRNTLTFYSEDLTNSLMIITTALVIVAYTFYTLTVDSLLIFTLPIVLYAIFRYYYFIYTKSPIAVNPSLVFKDFKFVISIIIWILITFFILYLR